jgi:Cd2+/Zn2+-exporting ATPase
LQKIKAFFGNLQQRRKFVTIAAGSLIVFAFGADYFFSWKIVHDLFMVAATLIAGWEIALHAFTSLRNRYVSIELLVTIATLGALWIGEYWEAAAVTFLFTLGAYLEARTLRRARF